MKQNPVLKETILQVVENQLRDDDPPETRITFNRLISEGYSEKDAKKLIGCAVTSEIFNVLKNKKEFAHQRYVQALKNLPELPWE